MASKSLFKSIVGKLIPATSTRNHEGAPAYAFSPEHALAQYAVTGCLSHTFYASAGEQLDRVLELSRQVDPDFVARAAVYGRELGSMKDMPALLCAALSVRSPEHLAKVFDRVIDNGRMLRNFVQIMRSGAVGRKSLGTLPKRLVEHWLERRADEALFRDSVGRSPSMADIVRMVHPKPASASREALYGYLIGREVEEAALPELVRAYEAFKRHRDPNAIPDVPFQMLTSLDLEPAHWVEIARRAAWQMTRMNLNTFARHGVFERPGLAELVAERLRDRKAIARARVLPYQLMVAYTMARKEVPNEVREALQDAMEIAIANVPAVQDKVYVCPDVSGSMTWAAVTGHRKGATSAVRCIDVAALMAAAFMRRNRTARVLPFEHNVVDVELNARDSVMTNASKLAAIGGGGTSCSAPLALLNRERARGELVVFISDNQSWVDARNGRGTAMMREWAAFKRRNTQARLVCLDIQPYASTQAVEREDILNIGGFSDQVFEVIARFARGELEAGHWSSVIEAIEV